MPDTLTFEDGRPQTETQDFSFDAGRPKEFSFEEGAPTLTAPTFDAASAQQPRLTPQERETATAPWYTPPPEWQKELIGHIDIPNAKNPALAPLVSLARAGAGIVNYFQTPQGITEAGLALTPAAPAVLAKWAVDMVEGGYMSVKELGNSIAGLIGAGISHGMIGPNQLGVSPDDSHKEITERIQDISDNVVNAALQTAGALGAGKGAIAEAKYLPKRFEPFQPPEPKLTVEDRGRLLNQMAQQYSDKMAADERLAFEAQAQAESGSPFTRAQVPQEPITMGVESGKIPALGAEPTFEPSGLGRPLERAEIPIEEGTTVEPGGEPGPKVGEAAQTVRDIAAQQARNDDFAKAVAERVLQEHEAPVHPDKPLTDNQLRIISDSLTQAIADNQIPGPRKGLVAGSALEKWADDTLQFNRGKFYTGRSIELLAAALVKGVALLEKGIVKFSDWAAEMIKEHGDAIRPHLKELFIRSTEERAKAFQKPKEETAPAQTAPTSQTPPTLSAPTPTPPLAQPGPTARPFGRVATPPVVAPPTSTPSLLSRFVPAEIRARFSDIGKFSKPLENLFTRTVNASTDARSVVNSFMRRAFGKSKDEQKRLVKDFVSLAWHNRATELQSRGIPASQVPILSAQEVNRIRADPKIQAAIQLWNKEIAPMITDIRTRNQMLMSPTWGSRDIMLNLPGEYEPGFQGKQGINPADVYNMPAKGEMALQRDPVEALKQVVGGHLRYDSAQQLVKQIKAEAINPSTVKSSTGQSNPAAFQEPLKGEKYTAPYKGRNIEVEAIDLSPDKKVKDLHYVPKPVADAWEHKYQERGNYNTIGDRVLGGTFITGGVLTGSFAPHVYRELTAVAGRIAQSGQSWWSVLPSWLGSNEYTLYRMMHDMRDTPYGHLMQRIVDRTGADRGTGFVPEPQSKTLRALADSKLGKLRPHDLLFNPNHGIDVMARRTIADASLIKKIGLDAMRKLEKDVNAGKVTVHDALQQIESKLSDKDMVSVGREVNNTMGYGNPQTRAQSLNWVQRILPFIASESGKIPDEIRRFVTSNISPTAIKNAAKRGEYAQLAKSVAGSLANGTVGVYLTISALNYLLNGKPASDNPEGRKTDVQIGKDLYLSNLDPGLARASRLSGGKELANDPHRAPDYKREAFNEIMSVVHPFARWVFTALSGKSGYLMPNGEFPEARRSDYLPISLARETMNAREAHKPVGPAVVKDVARLGGVQLVGKPPSKEKIEGARRNAAIDKVARKAKKLPLDERLDYVIGELDKQGYWDSQAESRLNRIFPGLFKYDDD